ncbi:MAG: carboxypeptidase regulatory-like domain-containing protein [Brevundimonas sp.]|uniref:TonB-dependent receptor n=1 Tax=Brevundimonas sp. TaxID=1871086 RepID=UPI00391B3CC0
MAGTMIGGVALAAAIALPVAAVVLAPTSASAQDYTTGGLAGNVVDDSGSPVAGATVRITSNEQGYGRTVTTDATGGFRISQVPQGSYTVEVSAPGLTSTRDPNVAVRVGGTATYGFTLTSSDGGTNLGDVVVIASRPELDFTQSTSGLTVNVDELVERVPLGRSATDVALLAPRVIQGDSGFGNQPSLGGSSVAENAFYVNGLNITNFNNYVGGATPPFDFYRTIDVQTGGYPAEFGRATGGIINATTKSGTNEFTFELHGNYAPDSLREDTPNILTRAGNDATLNDRTYSESWSLIAEAGGPIIRDRLYAYGLYQWQESETRTETTTGVRTTTINEIPFWAAKVDAYITDTQHLEFTYFNTEGSYSPEQTRVSDGGFVGGSNVYVGGENWVARYTGNFSDWFTLSAAYGVNEDQNYSTPLDPDAFYAADIRPRDRGTGPAIRIPGSNVSSATNFLSTEREFYRIDADVMFNAMGDHHVRFGMDNEDTTLRRSVTRTGGYNIYYYAGEGSIAPVGDDFLEAYVATLGGGGAPIEGNNRAFYIQDSWDITEDLNIQLGLRHDTFSLDNLAGQNVIELNDNWGPRFAFNLDPFGNNTDKFYGSYGRYFIPIASNLSFRGADLFYSAYFANGGTYDTNPDGTPVGGLGTPVVSSDFQICPAGAPGGAAGLRACLVNGDGSAEPADAKYAEGTKATNEDEFIVGYERRIDDLWSVGAAVHYRKLNNVSEDIAVDYLVRQYCDENLPGDAGDATTQLGQCYLQFSGDHQYVIANPGQDLTFLVREALPDGSRPTISFTAAETMIPPARRDYFGLELSFERAFDGKWSLDGSYTLSKSEGNYEGTVLSDNDQADAGSTILYDHLGLNEGKYGLLPNHRAHQFKLFGSYQIMEGLTIGANYSLISPRHFGCLSRATTDELSFGYGASAGVCRPDVLALAGNTDPYVPAAGIDGSNYADYAVTTPRGSVFTSDWVSTLDLAFRYTLPTFGFMRQGLTLRADVFNVFNEQAGIDYEEQGTSGNGVGANPDYGTVQGYQSPRQIRFGFDLVF